MSGTQSSLKICVSERDLIEDHVIVCFYGIYEEAAQISKCVSQSTACEINIQKWVAYLHTSNQNLEIEIEI